MVVERLQGVRVFGDLLPAGALDDPADQSAFLALEQAVATHPDHAAVLVASAPTCTPSPVSSEPTPCGGPGRGSS